MTYSIYQADAFTGKLFGGNPAAVIPLKSWLADEVMQQIAAENNLSETAFIKPSSLEVIDYDLRWFTPVTEVDLCGHATLASAFIIFNYLNFKKPQVSFMTKSGKLTVEKRAELYYMDFPSCKPEITNNYPDNLKEILGISDIIAVYNHRDLLVQLKNEDDIMAANPDFAALKEIKKEIIITAPGSGDVDFVSRFFAPAEGIDEDPVTGSAHSQLIPFWAEKLNKKKMHAKQLSKRGGELWCGLWGDRVSISGQCTFYMKGEITIPG